MISHPTVRAESSLDEFLAHWDDLIPDDAGDSDPDHHRRARVHARFGLLGAVFGTAFALFYLIIEHMHGAVIIAACSIVFAVLPFMLGKVCHLTLRTSANLYCFTLVTGFSSLMMVEGGMSGHAIGWFSVVPLCAVLLANRIDGLIWGAISLLITLAFGVCHVKGIEFPVLYPVQWAEVVNVVGFAGLVPFTVMLGLVFESTRRRSFDQLFEANALLEQRNAELYRLNQEKNEFLSIASHDLKNPLSVVSCYAELINRGGAHLRPSDVDQFSSEIQRSAKRMLNIVTSLLNVQSIEAGEMDLECEPCSVDELVEPLFGSFRQPAAKKEITLEGRIDLELPEVAGDPHAITQILDNLISNAVKYSPLGGTIVLRVVEEGGWITTTVTDNGPGLSVEDQSKLFGKFQRLTPQPTQGESSNGLGLWIVRRMAEGMDGQVFCESQIGRGSTFGLRLPIWEDDGVLLDGRSEFSERSADGRGVPAAASDRLAEPGAFADELATLLAS